MKVFLIRLSNLERVEVDLEHMLGIVEVQLEDGQIFKISEQEDQLNVSSEKLLMVRPRAGNSINVEGGWE